MLKGARLSRFELGLWGVSILVVTAMSLLSGSGDFLSLIASLIGVTALIYLAKGHILGQILTIVFSVFYGVISYFIQYYGEMITYLAMTAPIAVLALISWLRHPFRGGSEVETGSLTRRQWALIAVMTLVVTGGMYFVLKALDNANLLVSTVSIATSFVAACLTVCRSPYYALGYAANDVVLIVLWAMAAREDAGCSSMVGCFAMFLINDGYGFVSWRRMQRRQAAKQDFL